MKSSCNNNSIHKNFEVICVNDLYSAFVLEQATTNCFLELHTTRLSPRKSYTPKSSACHPGHWLNQNRYMHVMRSYAWKLLGIGKSMCDCAIEVSEHAFYYTPMRFKRFRHVLICFIDTESNVWTSQCDHIVSHQRQIFTRDQEVCHHHTYSIYKC